MSKISKKHDYEQEADELSLGIAKKSKNEKELTHNLGKSLDADFSKVRVSHEDLNGETAYTKGNDIHLDHSVDTGTSFGRQVLGHEMVHTAQQSGQGFMVSQAPAGTAQFFPEKDKNGDLKLKNKFSYRNDKEYQTMYKAYNEYIKDKKNPEKKMEAIKAASDYMMHNTDLSGFDANTNDMKKQKHQGRMAIAEDIIYNLTINDTTKERATESLNVIEKQAKMADGYQSFSEDESRKRVNGGMNTLKSVVNGKNVSKTLQTVTAGTLGNHMGASVENLNGVTMDLTSGVTPSYDRNGNVVGKTLQLGVGKGATGSGMGATTLHELTHMANGNVYGNMMEMSIADKVRGESEEDRKKRYDKKATRRYIDLMHLDRVNEKMKTKLNRDEIGYAGMGNIGKGTFNYLPSTLRAIATAGSDMDDKQAAKFKQINIRKLTNVNDLKKKMEEADLPTQFLEGEKEENLNQAFEMQNLNASMFNINMFDKNMSIKDMTSLIEYDSKITDMLFELETSGKYDKNNPAHRRLKAMVMEAYVERETQKLQNEADRQRESEVFAMNTKHTSQDDMDTEIDEMIKKKLESGDLEILSDPKIKEHVMKQWQKNGSAIVNGQDFSNGYTGNEMKDFRGNAAWVTNYGKLMKYAVTKDGKNAVDITMEGLDPKGKKNLAWNAMNASMNIADDIRDNEELQEIIKGGSAIFSSNETMTPEMQQTFLTNFLLNRVYTPELSMTAQKSNNTDMADISAILLKNATLPTGEAPQFAEESKNAGLNPILKKIGHDNSISEAIGESLGHTAKREPRRGFRRARHK